jgi:hypothetical protein
MPLTQHGACGLPLVISGVEERRQIHPDEHVGEYVARIEIWECPCGCTRIEQEGRTAVEGNIGG